MMKRLFWCFLPMILLCAACSRKAPDQPSAPGHDFPLQPATDTLLKTRLHGKPIELQFDKKLLDEVRHTLALAHKYATRPLTFTRSHSEDLTGDGREEQVFVSVFSKGGNWYVTNQILSKGRTLWQDTLQMDNHFLLMQVWQGSPVYEQLKPYTAFKEALNYTSFILDAKTADFEKNKVTGEKMRLYFKAQELTGKRLAKAMKHFNHYLNTYRGKCIFTLSLTEPNIFLWYEPEQRFVCVQ